MKNRKITTAAIGLMLAALASTFSGCESDASKRREYDSEHSYQETKETLETKELRNPLRFLTTDGTYRENLLSGKWVLEGTITNSATVAKFKDVVLDVTFYSRTKTLLGSEKYVVYEVYPPGSTKSFKIKADAPRATNSVGWEVSGASPVY